MGEVLQQQRDCLVQQLHLLQPQEPPHNPGLSVLENTLKSWNFKVTTSSYDREAEHRATGLVISCVHSAVHLFVDTCSNFEFIDSDTTKFYSYMLVTVTGVQQPYRLLILSRENELYFGSTTNLVLNITSRESLMQSFPFHELQNMQYTDSGWVRYADHTTARKLDSKFGHLDFNYHGWPPKNANFGGEKWKKDLHDLWYHEYKNHFTWCKKNFTQ